MSGYYSHRPSLTRGHHFAVGSRVRILPSGLFCGRRSSSIAPPATRRGARNGLLEPDAHRRGFTARSHAARSDALVSRR
jgi:hypothetical protein